jgi:transcriptional regulator with XRE-family HTH domain
MKDPAGEIGSNIRRRRQAMGLSLDALARRSGVSTTMLSEVERSVKNPTVKLAYQIARALGCTLTDLLSDRPLAAVTILRAKERRTLVDPESGVVRHGIASALVEGRLELGWYELPPRSSTGEMSPNRPGVLELVTVVEGTLTLVLGGEAHTLGVGDCATYAPSTTTEYRNDDPETPCRMILLGDHSRAG